jgi:hypothetical protein
MTPRVTVKVAKVVLTVATVATGDLVDQQLAVVVVYHTDLDKAL